MTYSEYMALPVYGKNKGSGFYRQVTQIEEHHNMAYLFKVEHHYSPVLVHGDMAMHWFMRVRPQLVDIDGA